MSDHASPLRSPIVRAYEDEAHAGRPSSGVMQQTVDDVEIILVGWGATDAAAMGARDGFLGTFEPDPRHAASG